MCHRNKNEALDAILLESFGPVAEIQRYCAMFWYLSTLLPSGPRRFWKGCRRFGPPHARFRVQQPPWEGRFRGQTGYEPELIGS